MEKEKLIISEIDATVKVSVSEFLTKIIEKASAKALLKAIAVNISMDSVMTAYSPLSNLLKSKEEIEKNVANLETFAMLTYIFKNWDKLKKDAFKCLNETYTEAEKAHNEEDKKYFAKLEKEKNAR